MLQIPGSILKKDNFYDIWYWNRQKRYPDILLILFI